MNKISFTCHIFAELKDKNQIATIDKILRMLRESIVEIEIPDTFCSETPVIIIREK